MASTSHSSAAGASAVTNVEEEFRSGPGAAPEALDEEMAANPTPTAERTHTPLSINTAEAQDESDLAPTFFQNSSSNNKKRQSGTKPADTSAIAVQDSDRDDDDDLMEPDLPGREESLLDEKIRARYIQEIGDIF
ncbi:uncharacterized protein UMAG_10808 [Mycosarcoma maydis]|uniref:Uncharacterized protein n=1 Tax=Mycosarcoma maydis TaxID=5270 RepID=A0A0D1CAK8_MYCMD|nr:uncharacterized protein UMAG_10808 [Ustilago maydis 521]KIS70367.1 hypothetical protein UMAG_10808 [Ustilago maydis 521]|eukprot:XP_011387985.1 hypothetical protein UMAG_10808 [Ustilago maydis 521]